MDTKTYEEDNSAIGSPDHRESLGTNSVPATGLSTLYKQGVWFGIQLAIKTLCRFGACHQGEEPLLPV